MRRAICTSQGIEVAMLDKVVVLARGTDVFTIPVTSLRDLHRLLGSVAAALDGETALAPVPGQSRQSGRTLESNEDGSENPSDDKQGEFISGHRPATEVHATARSPKPNARRGRIWEAVKQTLHESDLPMPYDELLSLVASRALTSKNPNHALRICLGKKLSSGELLTTPSGGYYLTPRVTPSATVERKSTRNRPGKLWQGIREYLGRHPGGLTESELATAASEQGWTTATQVKHAVRICLARVSDQVEQLPSGRYTLRSNVPDAPVKPSIVRRRRPQRSEQSEGSNFVSKEQNGTTSPATTNVQPDTPVFVASSFYPRRKQRG